MFIYTHLHVYSILQRSDISSQTPVACWPERPAGLAVFRQSLDQVRIGLSQGMSNDFRGPPRTFHLGTQQMNKQLTPMNLSKTVVVY